MTGELAVQRPQPLWPEQQPEDWSQAVEAAMADLRRRVPRELAAVVGIGLSGQMHVDRFQELYRTQRPLFPVA